MKAAFAFRSPRCSHYVRLRAWTAWTRRSSSAAAPSGPPQPEASSVRSAIVSKSNQVIAPKDIDSLIQRKLFFVPAFKPYRGVEGVETRGLYNYGPPGAVLQDNILDVWRKHFILEEDMLKVDCPVITPYEVFKTSGHVDKFTDYMCKDVVTGEHHRADHLVKNELERRLRESAKESKTAHAIEDYRGTLTNLDNYSCEELASIIDKFNIQSPDGNDLQPPIPVNLMFETPIGPSGRLRGYLRPETAQGQFLMFQELLNYNNQSMPFASASIGKSYRNEIAPKSGILRVREFVMAEIEHFMNPHESKQHARFSEVEQLEIPLLDQRSQARGSGTAVMTRVGSAVEDGIVDNETLAYFLARSYLFLIKIGIDASKMRFRQHLPNEMAHYAVDCWDVELLTSFGWIECVGIADRSAHDLAAHSKRTGEQLGVQQKLETSVEEEEYYPQINLAKLGPRFKADQKAVLAAITSLPQTRLKEISVELERLGSVTIDVPDASKAISGGCVDLDKDIITGIATRTVKKNLILSYIPNVVEPSFGIGRIMYALLEHSIDRRPGEDQARLVLSLNPTVAPTKVLIAPLQLNNPGFLPFAKRLQDRLRNEDVASRIDASGASIGKRYSRNDEVGVPLGITVDFQSLEDATVTLRDRDTTKQVRGSENEVCDAAINIARGKETWEEVDKRLGIPGGPCS